MFWTPAWTRQNRVYADGRIRDHGKTEEAVPRKVPLSARVLAALEDIPVRIDTPLLFPGMRGGYLDLHNWRRDVWKPALTAAGIEYRTPYAMRHTFISEALAAESRPPTSPSGPGRA